MLGRKKSNYFGRKATGDDIHRVQETFREECEDLNISADSVPLGVHRALEKLAKTGQAGGSAVGCVHKISLINLGLSDDVLRALCRALRGVPVISKLNLSGNQITAEGARHVYRLQETQLEMDRPDKTCVCVVNLARNAVSVDDQSVRDVDEMCAVLKTVNALTSIRAAFQARIGASRSAVAMSIQRTASFPCLMCPDEGMAAAVPVVERLSISKRRLEAVLRSHARSLPHDDTNGSTTVLSSEDFSNALLECLREAKALPELNERQQELLGMNGSTDFRTLTTKTPSREHKPPSIPPPDVVAEQQQHLAQALTGEAQAEEKMQSETWQDNGRVVNGSAEEAGGGAANSAGHTGSGDAGSTSTSGSVATPVGTSSTGRAPSSADSMAGSTDELDVDFTALARRFEAAIHDDDQGDAEESVADERAASPAGGQQAVAAVAPARPDTETKAETRPGRGADSAAASDSVHNALRPETRPPEAGAGEPVTETKQDQEQEGHQPSQQQNTPLAPTSPILSPSSGGGSGRKGSHHRVTFAETSQETSISPVHVMGEGEFEAVQDVGSERDSSSSSPTGASNEAGGDDTNSSPQGSPESGAGSVSSNSSSASSRHRHHRHSHKHRHKHKRRRRYSDRSYGSDTSDGESKAPRQPRFIEQLSGRSSDSVEEGESEGKRGDGQTSADGQLDPAKVVNEDILWHFGGTAPQSDNSTTESYVVVRNVRVDTMTTALDLAWSVNVPPNINVVAALAAIRQLVLSNVALASLDKRLLKRLPNLCILDLSHNCLTSLGFETSDAEALHSSETDSVRAKDIFSSNDSVVSSLSSRSSFSGAASQQPMEHQQQPQQGQSSAGVVGAAASPDGSTARGTRNRSGAGSSANKKLVRGFPASLQVLNVSYNMIHRISGLLYCGKSLVELNVSHNRIQNFTGVESLVELKRLDASFNVITKPMALRPLSLAKNLTDLSLAGNAITDDERKCRSVVVATIPQLRTLDSVQLKKQEKGRSRGPQGSGPAHSVGTSSTAMSRREQQARDMARYERYKELKEGQKKREATARSIAERHMYRTIRPSSKENQRALVEMLSRPRVRRPRPGMEGSLDDEDEDVNTTLPSGAGQTHAEPKKPVEAAPVHHRLAGMQTQAWALREMAYESQADRGRTRSRSRSISPRHRRRTGPSGSPAGGRRAGYAAAALQGRRASTGSNHFTLTATSGSVAASAASVSAAGESNGPQPMHSTELSPFVASPGQAGQQHDHVDAQGMPPLLPPPASSVPAPNVTAPPHAAIPPDAAMATASMTSPDGSAAPSEVTSYSAMHSPGVGTGLTDQQRQEWHQRRLLAQQQLIERKRQLQELKERQRQQQEFGQFQQQQHQQQQLPGQQVDQQLLEAEAGAQPVPVMYTHQQLQTGPIRSSQNGEVAGTATQTENIGLQPQQLQEQPQPQLQQPMQLMQPQQPMQQTPMQPQPQFAPPPGVPPGTNMSEVNAIQMMTAQPPLDANASPGHATAAEAAALLLDSLNLTDSRDPPSPAHLVLSGGQGSATPAQAGEAAATGRLYSWIREQEQLASTAVTALSVLLSMCEYEAINRWTLSYFCRTVQDMGLLSGEMGVPMYVEHVLTAARSRGHTMAELAPIYHLAYKVRTLRTTIQDLVVLMDEQASRQEQARRAQASARQDEDPDQQRQRAEMASVAQSADVPGVVQLGAYVQALWQSELGQWLLQPGGAGRSVSRQTPGMRMQPAPPQQQQQQPHSQSQPQGQTRQQRATAPPVSVPSPAMEQPQASAGTSAAAVDGGDDSTVLDDDSLASPRSNTSDTKNDKDKDSAQSQSSGSPANSPARTQAIRDRIRERVARRRESEAVAESRKKLEEEADKDDDSSAPDAGNTTDDSPASEPAAAASANGAGASAHLPSPNSTTETAGVSTYNEAAGTGDPAPATTTPVAPSTDNAEEQATSAEGGTEEAAGVVAGAKTSADTDAKSRVDGGRSAVEEEEEEQEAEPEEEEEDEIVWAEGFDEQYQRFYYFNTQTEESVWEQPDAPFYPYDAA